MDFIALGQLHRPLYLFHPPDHTGYSHNEGGNTMQSSEKLLKYTQTLLYARQKHLRETGGCFNVFSVLGRESDEVHTHCRLLYELLNPSGSHCMGDVFLRSFFKDVLRRDYPAAAPQVWREYAFSDGRIDLLIEGSGFCCPIEVKIYAGEQELQVKRYANFAANRAADWQVYYLTLQGDYPSEYSTGGKNDTAVTCISFARDITRWLDVCRNAVEHIPAIAEIIRQYRELISKLTGNDYGGEFMELQELIQDSKTSFESAAAIAQALTGAKADMLCRVFRDIENHMGDRLPKIRSDYQEKADAYFRGNRNGKHPSLSYLAAEEGDLVLSLQFELDWNLYFGLFCFRKTDGKYIPVKRDASLQKIFPDDLWKFRPSSHQTDWTVWWDYLPCDNPIDFRNCNDTFSSLYDQDYYSRIMEQIRREIDYCIEQFPIRKTALLK